MGESQGKDERMLSLQKKKKKWAPNRFNISPKKMGGIGRRKWIEK